MSRRQDGPLGRLPKDVRPLVGGAVLVAAVRATDAVWRRVARRPVPTADAAGTVDAGHDTDPRVVRDRLAYAALLGGALRLARRLGLPRGPR